MIAETIPNLHIQCSDFRRQQVYLRCNARKSTCNKAKNQWVLRDNQHVLVGEKNSGTTISPRGKTFIVGHSVLLDTKKTQLGQHKFTGPSSFEVSECSNSIIDIGPATILTQQDFKLTSNSPKGIECNRFVLGTIAISASLTRGGGWVVIEVVEASGRNFLISKSLESNWDYSVNYERGF